MSYLRIVIPNREGHSKRAKWKRTVLRDDDSGVIFVPAFLGSDERAVFIRASFDGAPTMMHKKHLFVSLGWMADEYPLVAEIKRNIIERFANELGR